MMGKCMFLRKGETHTKPVAGILASDLAVGSTVKLMEGSTAVEYLVVNQGIPGNSSLYDASCDGTWLLRKDCHSSRQWHTSDVNTYASSAINTWLNGDFFNSLGSVEQATVRQVKIPYYIGGGSTTIHTGVNGLSVKVFLLGVYETGWTESDNNDFLVDGGCLSYFSGLYTVDSKRIAYLNGSAVEWWMRYPRAFTASNVYGVYTNGNSYYNTPSNSYGIRPALILPSNALFNANTMLLKGVA